MAEVRAILVKPEGYGTLGEHFLMWAKAGRVRQPGEEKEAGWPATIEQFMEDVGAIPWLDGQDPHPNAPIQVPERLQGIQFVQSNMETLLVRLPPKALVEATEKELEKGGDYGLPGFYEQIFGAPPKPDAPMKDLFEIFRHRVGDYVIAHCK